MIFLHGMLFCTSDGITATEKVTRQNSSIFFGNLKGSARTAIDSACGSRQPFFLYSSSRPYKAWSAGTSLHALDPCHI